MTLPVDNILTDNALTVLSLILFVFWHPLDELATEPESLLFNVVELVSDKANPILEPVAPQASVGFVTKVPLVSTFSVPLVILECPSVLSRAIEPPQTPLPCLFIVHPLTLVHYAIWPRIYTMPIYLIPEELAFVNATIRTD